MSLVSRFIQEESGATAIEYALIAALIAVAAILAMRNIGTNMKATFNRVSGELGKAAQTN